ncbi:MAG: hypothetical protein ACRCX2_14815 [Paraclostridium sp.]
MALDKNDGTFKPSIEGVISGKTSQVAGMNALLSDLIGNDNYLNENKVEYKNSKGEYDPNKSYAKDDVVFMDGHEVGYVHEIIDGGYSDPVRYKETRRDYRISDRMYYKYDGVGWEMLLTELDEVSLNLYTVAHKPADQNYESTWDNFFPYNEIGRWLVHKDTCEEIAKMDKIYGDRRDGTSSAVANDWNGTNGDIAVKIPKLYVNYKHTSRGKRIRFYSYKNPTKKISLEAYVHPAFVTDFDAEAIYIGATKGRNISGQLRACEGALQVSQNIGWFLTASRTNRTADYCITPFSISCLLQDLFLMEFGSVHSQEILGQGRSNTTSASNAGTTKTLGDRSGRVSTDDTNGNVSYRGIEDCFGNVWEFGVGLIVDDNGYYHTNKLSAFNDKSKMTRLPISTILLDSENQRIKSYAKIDSKSTNHLNIPVEIGASDSTYYTDVFWCHNKGEENIALLFGHWGDAGACGMRALTLNAVASFVSSALGARFTFFKKINK